MPEGTKPGGGRDEGTKPGGGRDEGTKPGGGRGSGGQGSFGAGAGWVVVAFVSPVCMNISELACRILSGGDSTVGTVQSGGIGEVALKAQSEARKEEQERDDLKKMLQQTQGRYQASRGKERKPPKGA